MQNLLEFDTPENVSSYLIETAQIIYEKEIPIIASVIITDEIWGRLDAIMLRYYGRLDVLHIILDFNNIPDVTAMKVGEVIDLPNISVLNGSTKLNPILSEMKIPGINVHGLDNMTKSQQAVSAEEYLTKTTTPTKTTANPKLKVTVKKVRVDMPNGTLTF